ncbi:hypothetical protein TrVGV298_003990 [Trichoderma virens]|nr:hypothetical protein TrVGV298_003990 [Trichoderma virens]
MDDEARMSWLSGRPQRVLNLRPPPGFSGNMEYYAQWSVMDDQIMLALPAKEHATCPSLIYLADINASLSRDDNVVELKQVTELPFLASRVRLLSNRAGFITAEFRESENKLILRTHDWVGSINKEEIISADGIDGEIAVHGSSVALCVRDGPESPFGNCLGKSNEIAIWDIESGNATKIKIPQDERGPQCHRGNLQFATPSHIALGGHICPSHDKPYAVLRSIPITPSERNKGRYFHQHENFEYGHNHDAIAIPGSSAHNDVVVHHHQRGNRFTAADVGLLTGEIPSEAQPTPWYFTDRDLFKDFFHVFSDKVNARTLTGSIFDRLPSLVGNRLLVREDIEEYEHDEDNYHGYKASHSSFGTFQVLYLYDFDQGRCKALRQLSPQSERQDLETRLKERNPDANVTVTSRMFYTSIEEEDDREKDTSPEWEAHIRERWEIRWAREKGEAKFPTLEFDDPPEGRDDPRMLFTRSMICLPKIRDGEALAMTTSAIIELPAPNADGYVHYFGTE